MSSVTRPRGPLPPRVYWFRRLLVLGLAFGMVFGIGRLLGGQPGGTDAPSVRPAAASAASPTAGLTASAGPTPTAGVAPSVTPQEPVRTTTPLAVPTGPCLDRDVRVMPTVGRDAIAGSDITITLSLTTFTAPACTWEVSSRSVVLRLTSGSDRIWSTQDCPSAVPTQPVVLRRDQATTVDVVWSGQRSDGECSRTTPWAQPGYYHASAAAFGAEPSDLQFRLLTPLPPTITPSPTAEPGKSGSAGKPSGKPSRTKGPQQPD